MLQEGTYTCVNCQLQFSSEPSYKDHYRSEHHRYNVKRKLIGLPPLSLHDYTIQFNSELSSKSQSTSEIYCDVCSKKFMSAQTYKQHINSLKHKTNRKNLLHKSQDKSQTSSMSEFQLIDEKAIHDICPFCHHGCTEAHLQKAHCFPPFKQECNNVQGLLKRVHEIVNSGTCVYCEQQFGNKDSVKQHMEDVGHGKLDLQNFQGFEQYYLWKIDQSSEEEEQAKEEQILKKKDTQDFSLLKGETLESLQLKRQGRIKYGPTGITINGREVGYRAYRQYYKQYLTRQIETVPREVHPAIQADSWRQAHCLANKPAFQKITTYSNPR